MNILLGILTFALIVISILLVLLVLAQKAKNDGGMGAALGGGMAESAFGADTGNVLSKSTINLSIAFFVLAFALYLGRIYQRTHATDTVDALPTIAAPAAPAATPANTATPEVPATQPAAAEKSDATTQTEVAPEASPANGTQPDPAKEP